MKFETRLLKENLSVLAPAIAGKSVIPVCENVRIKTEGKKVTLTGTDLNITIVKSFESDFDNEDQEFLIHYKTFSEYLKMVNEVEVKLEVQKNKMVEIIAGKSDATLEGEKLNNFPEFEIASENELSMNMEFIQNVAKKVIPFREVDSVIGLSVICFKTIDGTLKAYASDGNNMAVLEAESQFENDFDILFGAELSHVPKVFNKESELKLSFNERNYTFSSDSCSFSGRRTEGNYPDVEKVLKKFESASNNEAEINNSDLIKELKKAQLFGDSVTKQVRFTFDQNELSIKSRNDAFGTRYDNAIKCSYDGEKLEIMVSAQGILKALECTEGDNVKVKNSGEESKPLIIVSEGMKVVSMPFQLPKMAGAKA